MKRKEEKKKKRKKKWKGKRNYANYIINLVDWIAFVIESSFANHIQSKSMKNFLELHRKFGFSFVDFVPDIWKFIDIFDGHIWMMEIVFFWLDCCFFVCLFVCLCFDLNKWANFCEMMQRVELMSKRTNNTFHLIIGECWIDSLSVDLPYFFGPCWK